MEFVYKPARMQLPHFITLILQLNHVCQIVPIIISKTIYKDNVCLLMDAQMATMLIIR